MKSNVSNTTITRSVKQLEKEIYRSTSLLGEVKKLTDSLRVIEEQARNIEELTEKDPKLSTLFKEQMKDKEIIARYKELESNLHLLSKFLRKHEEPGFRLDLFLENFRTSNNYSFPSEDNALKFLNSFYSANRIKEAFFGPKMIGVIDLNEISKALKLQKASPNYLKVPVKKLPKLIAYLKENQKTVEYVIDSEDTRISFVDLRQTTVKSTPEKIKQFDRLCKLNDGKSGV